VAHRLRSGGVALVALLALGAVPATSGVPSPLVREPAPRAVLSKLVQASGGSPAGIDAPRFRYLGKLDGHLQDVAATRLAGGSVADARIAAERQEVQMTATGDVAVDVYVNGDLALAEAQLRALGMRVIATSERAPGRMVEGLLPSAALAQAAALGSTHAVVANAGAAASTGAFTSQGDAAIHGPQARATGVTGTGVRVGIVSTSIDQVGGGISDSQATGDLPGDVTDLLDHPGDDDEGRAMAEIVYDEAPGISGIAFATGMLGPASKASSIDALVANGVKVIADDTYYRTEPFFQDGIVSQAVDRAKASGVAYLAAAGNEASQSWEAAYTPVPDPSAQGSPSTEDSDPGPAVDTVQSVATIPAGSTAYLSLQWAEPWTHATSDFAVDVYDTSVSPPPFLFTIDSDNLVSGIPAEFGGVTASQAGAATFGIAIRRRAGTGTPLLKYVVYTSGVGTVSIEHATGSGTIATDAGAARGALTVAAANAATPTTPEPYSSRGTVTRRFDVNGTPLATPELRQKPDVAGPDAVSTSVPGLFTTFRGTSAATPAVAGIAALLLSANRTLSVDQLYAILRNPANALPCATAQPAIACGVGFVLADRAVAEGRDRTPPLVTPILSPAVADGANGWYRAPVSVQWSVSDPESPIANPGVCVPASLGDGGATLTCSATSLGGTTSVPISVKRDSTPPSTPVIVGIAPRTYDLDALPAASTIACGAGDDLSGVTSCLVEGYSSAPGAHTLLATATNGAGASSTSTLEYAVAGPAAPAPTPPGAAPRARGSTAAVGGLSLTGGLTLSRLARSGLPLSVRVAAPATRLVLTLVARIPNTSGTGSRAVTVARLTTRAGTGTIHLRLTLTASGRRRLAPLQRVGLTVTVSASAPARLAAKLRRSLVLRR
jgi:hypothetical protein